MKIIDLLNKIANEEEVPERIEYINNEWVYNYSNKDYCRRSGSIIYWFSCSLFDSEINTKDILNDEIEIIEEETTQENTITPETIKCLGYAIGNMERLFKSGFEDGFKGAKKIEKITFGEDSNKYRYQTTQIRTDLNVLANKINEIIDYINKGE